MNKSVVITGGSGFIGSHLIQYLIENNVYNNILVLDIVPPIINNAKVKYLKCDIRDKILVDISAFHCDACIHLAALCKEPGYKWDEYFETNYTGTKNVCEFASQNNIKNIVFTSTMMVFKASEYKNNEESLTAPDTAYGMSKLLAEKELEIWEKVKLNHRIRILRPGVVFGRGENGNFTRLAIALQSNLFVYVGRKDTIKGSIYVKDVVNVIIYLLNDQNNRTIYNFVFPEPDTIENICFTICEVMGWKRYIPVVPYNLLLLLSYPFEFLDAIGIKNPIHHRRIEKLFHSTYLSADAVIQAGFRFSYTLKSAIEDWKHESGGNQLN